MVLFKFESNDKTNVRDAAGIVDKIKKNQRNNAD